MLQGDVGEKGDTGSPGPRGLTVCFIILLCKIDISYYIFKYTTSTLLSTELTVSKG
jgi:hypothetical protein